MPARQRDGLGFAAIMAPGGHVRNLGKIPPDAGAIVMGTGVVSIALSLDGQETLSRILLVIAAGAWIGLGLVQPSSLKSDRNTLHNGPKPSFQSRFDHLNAPHTLR